MRLFNWPFYRTQDDRGQTIQISMRRWWRGVNSLEYSPQSADPALTDLTRRIHGYYTTPSFPDLWLTLKLILILLPGVVIAVSIGFTNPIPFFLVVLSIFVMMALTVILDTQRKFRKIGSTIISTMLAEGRCPVCAYIIAGSAVHPDSCIACPECSSAWKQDRIRISDQLAHVPAPSRLQHIHPGTRLERLMKYMNRRNIHDARNRVVTLIHPFLVGLHPHTYAELGLERVLSTRLSLQRSTRRSRWIWTALFLCGILTFSSSAVFRLVSAAGSGSFKIVNFYSLLAPIFWTFVMSTLALKKYLGYSCSNCQEIAQELIAHNICPSCAADLAPLSNDEDGCVECDSCGCYWRRFVTTSAAHQPLPARSAE